MASLAYLLLPVSGLVAYFSWAGPRVRFHGAQAICFSLVWAVALYAGSFVAAALTQMIGVAGALVWLGLIITTALGRDIHLPLVGPLCATAAGLKETD